MQNGSEQQKLGEEIKKKKKRFSWKPVIDVFCSTIPMLVLLGIGWGVYTIKVYPDIKNVIRLNTQNITKSTKQFSSSFEQINETMNTNVMQVRKQTYRDLIAMLHAYRKSVTDKKPIDEEYLKEGYKFAVEFMDKYSKYFPKPAQPTE